MSTSDRKDAPERTDASDEAPADTAPEIAADDAGASAMAERKGKEMEHEGKS